MLLTLKRSVIFVFPACLAFTICAIALAANAQNGDKEATRVVVIGCLQKGDGAEEFAISGEDGKKYELVSRTIKLSGHVGHKVRVTGTVLGEEDEENEGQEEAEGGWIQVTSLKMISETCK